MIIFNNLQLFFHIYYIPNKLYFWVVCVFWWRNACHLLLLSSQSPYTSQSLLERERERERESSESKALIFFAW